MNAATLINQDSGNVEIFTPPAIIEAARRTLGGRIELDPASCEAANRTVRAERFFTKEDDGLAQEWIADTVWLNMPFGRGTNKLWIDKLIRSVRSGGVWQACCITFASTSEAWFRPLLDYPQCFLSPRTNYLLPDGTVYRGVTKGSVVTCLDCDEKTFRQAFADLGVVKV